MFNGSNLPHRVRVGLAGQRCVMRTLEVPPLKDRKELAQAVAFTASQEMPMPLDSALTDFHDLGEVETKAGPASVSCSSPRTRRPSGSCSTHCGGRASPRAASTSLPSR